MSLVADSSALVAVATCGCLHLLEPLYGVVNTPQAVFDEVTISGKPHAETLRQYLSGKVVAVDLTKWVIVTAGGLGRGELEAMALYKNLGADVLFVDDRRARKIAQANGIRVIGSVGVLLFAKEQGCLEAIKPLIEQLRASRLSLAEDLLAKALQMAQER